MQFLRTVLADRKAAAGIVLRTAAAIGCATLVCACNTDQRITGAPTVPTDYRLRHPITITQADRTLEVFIGDKRGSLTATQRAEVLAFAQRWRSEATGGVIVAVPVGTANARASAAASHEIRSILAATGVPPRSMVSRGYHVPAGSFAPIRIVFPSIVAQAGPCGLWPEDIGPSNRDYVENQPPWNFGCATQRNLAAMVANPADLVQPRAETPAYAMRRTTIMEQYRSKGNPVTSYSSSLDSVSINGK